MKVDVCYMVKGKQHSSNKSQYYGVVINNNILPIGVAKLSIKALYTTLTVQHFISYWYNKV